MPEPQRCRAGDDPAAAAAVAARRQRCMLRSLCAGDAAAMAGFLQRLSPRSRRGRFHAALGADVQALARRLCAADGQRHAAWAAWAPAADGGAPTMIGEARCVVPPGERRGEFALAVADAWHGRGVADALLARLLQHAAARGLSALHGDVLPDNGRMLAFLDRHGFREVPAAPHDDDTLRYERRVGAGWLQRFAAGWWPGDDIKRYAAIPR